MNRPPWMPLLIDWTPTANALPSGGPSSDPMVYVLAFKIGWPRIRLLGYYQPDGGRWYNEEDNQLHQTPDWWSPLPDKPLEIR